MGPLTSIDYARLIQYVAQNFHRQSLNKTQVNKILFVVYGRYLATFGQPLFADDKPKAWPYGPVFPIVNKRIDIKEIIRFTEDKIEAFKKNRLAQEMVVKAVKEMYMLSAKTLTDLSHAPGTPWYRTIYREDGTHAQWDTEIPAEYITEYFR